MNGIVRFVRREPSVLVAYIVLAVIVAGWVLATPRIGILPITYSLGQKLPLVCVTIGAAIVLISRGVDLSIGGTLTLVNVIIAKGTDGDQNFVLWAFVALLAALAAGVVNGLLVAWRRLSPLIATLATQSILLGLALYILPIPGGEVPSWVTRIPVQLVGGLPVVGLLIVLVPLLLWWPLKRSPYGTALYAVGNDEGAAFTSGIRVRLVTGSAYVLAAFFAWLGGVFLTMNAGSGDPSIGIPYTLNAIAAAVIGGVALSGGRGTIVGAVAGALILSFINNLLFALEVSVYWQYLATGVLLLTALTVPFVLDRMQSVRLQARQRRRS
jgi:ribose transport system permease protein